MTKSQQQYEVQKQLEIIDPILQDVALKGIEDPTAKYWYRELEGPINKIRKALEID